jgi:type VI secretion system protein ImpK
LRGTGLDIGASSNPIIASASDLLVLLGRLRTGLVEMQAIPLRDHVVREINGFVQKASERGVSQEDIEVARYALAATSDDIVQTIPGTDPTYWHQYSMAAELLNDRSAGIGFFKHLDQVMTLSHQRKDVLELMLTCLSLGFEGKFRTEPNGYVALTRLRNEIYRRFRSIEPHPGQEMSLRWTPVIMGGRRKGGGVPLWIMSSIAAGIVMALFATLSWVLSTEAQASQDFIIALHDPDHTIAIEAPATSSTEPENRSYEAPVLAQLDRLNGRLNTEIEKNLVTLNPKGDFISIRLGTQLRFGSGSADLKSEFASLAERIGQALETETGIIIVEGHSDNIPLRGTGRYKSNEQLSEARATTVSKILSTYLSDPNRVSAIGRGPNDPIDTAQTREARAKNRRVEILLQKGQ